jgi:UDP-N-acetylmuramate dehydrogenase
MQIKTDVSLRDYSTMRLGGLAKALTTVSSEEELLEAIKWAQDKKMPPLMIGGGSNILWKDEGYPGLIIVNHITGYHEEIKPDGDIYITAGSGENWDAFIARTTAKGYTGIENLSLIPGTVGATPIQNVGAYYQDISDTLVELRAYDLQENKIVTLSKADCHLSYRSSRFKTTDRGRFFIISITFRLEKRNPEPPFYPSLQQYLDDHNITSFTPQVIRDAVIAVRSAKLPDPAKVANNGSFFANPMITREKLDQLQVDYNNIMHWPVGQDLYKIPAAWLVQEAGFKGYHDQETGMATWPTQAIVLVNEHAPNTAAALKFKQKIVDAVEKKFGITLVQEPEVL